MKVYTKERKLIKIRTYVSEIKYPPYTYGSNYAARCHWYLNPLHQTSTRDCSDAVIPCLWLQRRRSLIWPPVNRTPRSQRALTLTSIRVFLRE